MQRDIAPDFARGSDQAPSPAILRTRADIDRLIIRLLFQWNAPRIEVQLDSLPPLHVQHTQQRLEQFHERTIGSWGVIAAGLVLALGSFHAWTRVRQWQQLGNVLIATVAVWLAGHFIEAVWRRLRLVWALVRLRRQVVTGKGLYAGSTQAPVDPEYDLATPGPAITPAASMTAATAAEARTAADADAVRSDQRAVLIADDADVAPVLGRFLVPWPLPRIELRTNALPALDLQRTQQRLTDLSAACNCVLGAVLAGITLLAGGFYIVMTSDDWWKWMNYWEVGPGLALAASVLGAGLAGWLIETALTRVRLAAVLLRLRSRLQS